MTGSDHVVDNQLPEAFLPRANRIDRPASRSTRGISTVLLETSSEGSMNMCEERQLGHIEGGESHAVASLARGMAPGESRLLAGCS